MAIVESTISAPVNACRDVIGVRGMCNKTYPYYLDTLGISLPKAAKLADSASVNAKTLIEEAIDSAWGDVFGDLRADGFKVNGVQRDYSNKFTTEQVGAGTYGFDIARACDIEQINLTNIQVAATGTVNANITLNADGILTTLYNDTLTDEVLTINFDASYPYDRMYFTAVITGDGTVTQTSDGGVIKATVFTECSERLLYCKYWAYLVKAVMYKAAATILNASLFSDRYNDLIVYKGNEIATRVAQLDSSLNLLPAEQRVNAKGLYQLEIEKANDRLKEIVKQSYCTCCFECDNVISSRISIP